MTAILVTCCDEPVLNPTLKAYGQTSNIRSASARDLSTLNYLKRRFSRALDFGFECTLDVIDELLLCRVGCSRPLLCRGRLSTRWCRTAQQ